MPREYTWLDTKYYEVPCVIGLNKEESSEDLKDFDAQYSGTGDAVIYQSPSCGTYVKEKSTVLLKLN